MDFLGGSSSASMLGSGSSTSGQIGRFVAQGSGTAYVQGAADLLKQVKQLMAAAKKEKIL